MKNHSVKIVPMKRGHIPACTDIVSTSEPWKTLGEGVDFAAAIRRRQAHVAIVSGAVAGFVIFAPEAVFARGGYLRAIGVSPAIRGFGIGSRLLSFAEKTTAKTAQYLYLCVSSFNRAGQAFYRERGYSKAGVLGDLVMKGSSEYIYWKKLRRRSGRSV